MARKRQKRKGISIGTIVTLALVAVTLIVGISIFASISGDLDEISLDPKMLTEPLAQFTQTMINTEPQGEQSVQETAGDAPDVAPDPAVMAATLPPEPTATPEPTAAPVRTVSLNAVGLVALGNELRISGRDGAGAYDYTPAIAPVAQALAGADLTIATLRTSLSATSGAYDAYRAPAELVTAMKGAGVDIFNFATDHLLDHGMQGVKETHDIIRDQAVTISGAYTSLEERQEPAIHKINDVNIGILSFTTNMSAASKKAVTADELSVATRQYEASETAADIAALRNAGADIIVVLANWGSRSDAAPSPATKEIANALVGAGADIILGTNPSSVHEIERRTVNDADGRAREVLIAYSLGNFLMDESRDTSAITAIVLHIGIEWDAQARKATYVDNWYMPTWIMRWKDAGGVSRYRVVPSGTATKPDDMLDSIYVNMKKTYQSMATKLGETAARPLAEP